MIAQGARTVDTASDWLIANLGTVMLNSLIAAQGFTRVDMQFTFVFPSKMYVYFETITFAVDFANLSSL